MAATAQRYTAVAIVLHWAIAFAILLLIPLGFWMHISVENGNAGEGVFRAFQLHKSIGLTVLALSLVRLGWRLLNPPPPLPEHMPGWERFAAKATHWIFYALTIGLPLSGWLYVSAQWSVHDDAPLPVATHFFGLFRVPDLFNLSNAGADTRADAAEAAFTAHYVMAYAAIGLAVLHVAAALKHQFFDKDQVLAHMVPGLRAPFETEATPKNPGRLAVLGLGLSATVAALCAALFFVLSYVSATNAPATNGSSFEVVETPNTSAPPAETTEPSAPMLAPETPAAPDAASAWRVNAAQSSIRYSFALDDGEGATRIEGRFSRWRADIRFDPNDLANSAVSVVIQTASADNGIPSHNELLPQAAWFDSAQYPTATFTARDFRRRGESYEARGELTIKGRERNETLPFTLVIDGNTAVMNGQLTIDRRAYNVGDGTDADDMIGREVQVNVRVEATRAP